MYTFDTNAVIYHLNNEPGVQVVVDEIIQSFAPAYVSVITITELFRFPKLSLQEESAIEDLLFAFSVIPLDAHMARKAADIGRTFNLKLADSVIAATALFTGSTLLTRNVRDFRRVPSLLLKSI